MALAKLRAGLLNHLWKVVLLVAIGIGAGYAFTLIPPAAFTSLPEPFDRFPPPSGYQSVVSLYLNTAETSETVPYVRSTMQNQTSAPGVATLASTLNAYLKSGTFAQRLGEQYTLGIPPESVAPRIRTRLVPDTNILEVTITWDSPEGSRLIAEATGKLLIAEAAHGRQTQEVWAALRTQAEFAKQQIAAIQNDLNFAQRDRTKSANERDDQLRELRSQLLTASDMYSRILSTQVSIQAGGPEGTSPAAVLDQPQPGRFSPRPWLAMLIGAFGGLALGIGLVLFDEFMNPTIDVASDLEELLGAPVVSALNTFRRFPAAIDREAARAHPALSSTLVAAVRPGGRAAESVRRLRAQVEVAADRRTVRSVLVTSARRGEGRSVVAANLAIAMAQAGKRVILVDADLQKPDVHNLFGLPNVRGLTDLFGWAPENGEASPAGLVHAILAVPNLYVLPAGARPRSQTDSLSVAQAADLVGLLSELADLVIFDAAPASLAAASLALASQLDGVLVVARARVTRSSAAEELSDHLALVHADVIGGVLNGAPDAAGIARGNHRRGDTLATASSGANANRA
jgi:polysaccharide biosynthesis transport protein